MSPDATESNQAESDAVNPNAVHPNGAEFASAKSDSVKPDSVKPDSAQPSAATSRALKVRVLQTIPVTVVLIIIVVGVVIVADDRWQLGSVILAAAAGLGAVLRLVLPTSAVGVLAVRSRVFDVAMFVAMSALLAGMALVTVTPHA